MNEVLKVQFAGLCGTNAAALKVLRPGQQNKQTNQQQQKKNTKTKKTECVVN